MSVIQDRDQPGRRLEDEEADLPELSVVVPAFNSALYIGQTVRELVAFFEQSGIRGEIVVVDDGSADDTYKAAAVSPLARVFRLYRNRGKGAALRAGMIRARGTIRAFTDADLPYGTRPLESAMHYINDRGFHAVVGDRTLPGSTYLAPGPARGLISDAASFAFRTLVTGGIYDTQCGMKVFRGDVAAELFPMTRVDGFAVDVEIIYLLLKYRLDIKRLPVQLRNTAPSSVKLIRDSARAARDIGSIRVNWAMGRYRSDYLLACLAADLERDGVAWGHRRRPSTVPRPTSEAAPTGDRTSPAPEAVGESPRADSARGSV